MFKKKKTHRFEVNESKPFKVFVKDFWEKHGDDFPHVHLENFIFLKNEEQKFEKHEHYVEIKMPDKLMRMAFPKIKYVLIAYPSFNFLNELEIDKVLYHCFSHVPKDYKTNLYLKEHDIETFVNLTEKFKKEKIKRIERTITSMQD